MKKDESGLPKIENMISMPEAKELMPKISLTNEQLAVLLKNIHRFHEECRNYVDQRAKEKGIEEPFRNVLIPLFNFESELQDQIDMLLGKERRMGRLKNMVKRFVKEFMDAKNQT